MGFGAVNKVVRSLRVSEMVEIRYKVRGSDSEQLIELTADEYFDPVEPGERYATTGVPAYNRLSSYLRVDESSVEWARLSPNAELMIDGRSEQYSADGRFWIWQRDDLDGGAELCIETRLSADQVHLARLHFVVGRGWSPNYLGVITDLADGSQIETMFFLPES